MVEPRQQVVMSEMVVVERAELVLASAGWKSVVIEQRAAASLFAADMTKGALLVRASLLMADQ